MPNTTTSREVIKEQTWSAKLLITDWGIQPMFASFRFKHYAILTGRISGDISITTRNALFDSEKYFSSFDVVYRDVNGREDYLPTLSRAQISQIIQDPHGAHPQHLAAAEIGNFAMRMADEILIEENYKELKALHLNHKITLAENKVARAQEKVQRLRAQRETV